MEIVCSTRTAGVRNALRRMIGAMPENGKLPGEFELCEQFGVSRGTIRDAVALLVAEGLLEKRHGVGTFVRRDQDMRTKVLLVLRRVPRVLEPGALEHRMVEYNFEKYLRAVSEECLRRKAVHSSLLWKSLAHFEKQLEGLPESSRLVGVMLTDELDHPQRRELERFLDERGLRHCSIDPVDVRPRPSSIGVRQEAGIAAGLERLWELGHRRVAFLGVPRHLAGAEAGEFTGRHRAFLDFFKGKPDGMAGVTVVDDQSDYTRTYEEIQALLERENPPTAIFCQNDVRGVVALEVCARLGVKVPRDLSLLGFDNNPETALVKPQLSSVDLRVEERARLAARHLFGEPLESGPPLALDSMFIERESMGEARK